jgi:hypothetical protein
MSGQINLSPEHLHYLLVKHVIDTGHAPELNVLASMAKSSDPETSANLRALADMHGVILEPNSLRIWSLHPFALMPTAFWVSSGNRGWWANCAWCSLGIGAALGQDFSIHTSEGAEGAPLHFEIKSGKGSNSHVLMHFPYPPARWWDNPYCPCGNILFFASEVGIDRWCARHGRPRGSVLRFDTARGLSQLWFGDYASPQWRRKTPQQAVAIFKQLNLDPRFWTIPDTFR